MTDLKAQTEKINGCYLLDVEEADEGYRVRTEADVTELVDTVRVNGRYIGAERFEIECDDFEIGTVRGGYTPVFLGNPRKVLRITCDNSEDD